MDRDVRMMRRRGTKRRRGASKETKLEGHDDEAQARSPDSWHSQSGRSQPVPVRGPSDALVKICPGIQTSANGFRFWTI